MTDFDILKSMIKKEHITEAEPCGKLHKIVLKEDCPTSTYSVNITDVPRNSIAIKTDAFPDAKDFFDKSKSGKELLKRADFVVIAKCVDGPRVLYVELTERKKSHGEITNQLRGAKCVFDYCQSVGKMFWKHTDFLRNNTSHYLCVKMKGNCAQRRNFEKGAPKSNLNDVPERHHQFVRVEEVDFKIVTKRK